ncbi:MAG: metallophosphoesterase [Polyangiales bacterium]
MSDPVRIGVLGDLHGHWDDWDARYFGATGYDLVLFTGDLGSGTGSNGVRIARSIGRLDKPALVMPGNNDVTAAVDIAAELGHQRGLSVLRRLVGRTLGEATGQVHPCGYSAHAFEVRGHAFTVIAARPYARGGGELSSPDELRARFGVETMEQATARLCTLVETAPTEVLVVLAHNGPHGLGDTAVDIWGRDFAPEAGDWGDPDLTVALAHARAHGKKVLAVVAGHMHLTTRDGRTRAWQVFHEGTLYVNAARVPRIFGDGEGTYRHHVVLELDDAQAVAREVLVREAE